MSSLPQGGFQQRAKTGRRRALVYGGLLFLFLVIWSAVVLSWGPSAEEAGTRRQDGSQAAGEQAQGSGSGGEREAVPQAPASAQQEAGGGAPEGIEGDAPAAGGQSGGEEATPTGQDAPAGAGHQHAEPAGFRPDPLGTGASDSDLAPIDEERVRFAAARFVTAAYGYSGDDADAYNQGVGSTVAWPVFYESPGSKEIGRFAAQVEETGTKSSALLTRFELTGGGGSEASGWAYFQTGEGYGENGGITGEKLSYRQKMTLVRSGGAWIVKHANPIQET